MGRASGQTTPLRLVLCEEVDGVHKRARRSTFGGLGARSISGGRFDGASGDERDGLQRVFMVDYGGLLLLLLRTVRGRECCVKVAGRQRSFVLLLGFVIAGNVEVPRPHGGTSRRRPAFHYEDASGGYTVASNDGFAFTW